MSKEMLPKIISELCIGCGHCVLTCEPKLLKLVNKKSTIPLRKSIEKINAPRYYTVGEHLKNEKKPLFRFIHAFGSGGGDSFPYWEEGKQRETGEAPGKKGGRESPADPKNDLQS